MKSFRVGYGTKLIQVNGKSEDCVCISVKTCEETFKWWVDNLITKIGTAR